MQVPRDIGKILSFIGTVEGDGVRFRGTGFFVEVPAPHFLGTSFKYLVTAKHVADGTRGRPVVARVVGQSGEPGFLKLTDAPWWFHPSSATVDVAVVPVNLPDEVDYGALPLSQFLTAELAAEYDVGLGDEVFIIGMFAHVAGRERNAPFVRTGNVAMLPDEPIPTALGEMNAYLIEARSIGGLSGSPVFVTESSSPRGRRFLLGIVHGHWDIPPEYKNDLLVADSTDRSAVNMGVAIVTPATAILDVLMQPKLQAERYAVEAQKTAERISE